MGIGSDKGSSCLCVSHSGSRYMTTEVLGPNLSGPAPVAGLKKTLESQQGQLPEYPHLGLIALPTIVYFVSPHNR